MGSRHHQEESHHGGEEHGGEEGWLISYADLMTLLVGFFVILMSFSKMDEEKFEEVKLSVTKEFGGRYEAPYEQLSKQVEAAIKKAGLEKQVQLRTDATGVEIRFLGTAFFDLGSVDVKEAGQVMLHALIKEIEATKDKYQVVIEGHTDDVPLSGGTYKNNFELSSIRACRVLDLFLSAGFPIGNVTAVGYGESRPIVPNRDANGVAIVQNQTQNRRVIIKIKDGETKTF